MNDYSKKLKDPRWQKKRLEIMERDEWKCKWCKSKTEQLNVHHLIYFPKTEIWEYPSSLLVTLCDDCHKDEHEQKRVEKLITAILRTSFGPYGLDKLADAFEKLAKIEKGDREIILGCVCNIFDYGSDRMG
jgi:hypothetical protein